MGIALGAYKILVDEAKRRPFSGTVLQLGRQNIFFDLADAAKAAGQMGFTLRPLDNPTPPHDTNHRKSGYLSDIDLFTVLGFNTTTSMDTSGYEGATYLHDLNQSEPPVELHGKFDMIFDGGTLEHIFNIPNALRNIHMMLKPDGRIMHVLPVSNYIDHGFYMFSPTLFWDYYMANDYEINTSHIFRHTVRHNEDPWLVYDYKPGSVEHVSFGGLDSGMFCLIWLATKKETSTCDVVPQQGRWIPYWAEKVPVAQQSQGINCLMQKIEGRIRAALGIEKRGIRLPELKRY